MFISFPGFVLGDPSQEFDNQIVEDIYLASSELLKQPLHGSDTTVNPPEFSIQPSWPDQNYYDEDGPPIHMSCDVKSITGLTQLWYKDGYLIQPLPQMYPFT